MNAATRTELEGLITALLEQEVTTEQKERLEELLRTDWECRRFYLEHADLHARLLQAPAIAAGKLIEPRLARRLMPRWLPLAAAAVILITASLAYFLGERAGTPAAVAEQTENGCAVVAQLHGNTGLQPGAILKPGVLTIPGGLARIEFFSGATLLLEGPAALDIRSAWEAACRSGRARVRVPPPAQGFKLQAPGMMLVDLGTEFGVSVDELGAAEVHVFEGGVEAYPEAEKMRLLTDGMSLRRADGQTQPQGVAQPAAFTSIEKMDELTAAHAGSRFEAWWAWSKQMRKDPRLIAYYAFKHWENDRWDRLVNNFTEPRNPTRAGAAVGARWTQGRWPMKDALEFKGPGDRVRIHLGPEKYDAITLACWVRVDGLDRKYNALLLTDGYDAGEPHWQIFEDGRLMFSIAYTDSSQPEAKKRKRNQIYYSPSVFNLADQRRWHHLAVTYVSQTGEVIQYLDGHEISREVSPLHQPGRPISFGPAEIGNWGLPTEGHQFPIRNLNGRIDEFAIYGAALTSAEILQLYEAGKPD